MALEHQINCERCLLAVRAEKLQVEEFYWAGLQFGPPVWSSGQSS
jgi:hypothetical protein